ncbi:MAG: xanthine dehydrogenase family protein molybdopterin-binding subunit [Thermodesulfobacteriota bacterium]
MTEPGIGPTRRRFLKTMILAGGGLVVGVYLGTGGEHVKSALEVWDEAPGAWAPNAWVRVGLDGWVTVRVNHTELGQGIATALPMIVAEELEADWDRVRFEIAPAEAVYKNPDFGTQMTAGSTSVRTSWEPLRQAGAVAREMLRSAAASTWGVPLAECRASQGRVRHDPSGRELEYGKLALKAAALPVPPDVRLKSPAEFRIVGRGLRRLDGKAKVEGRAIFGLDVRLPGILTAAVVHAPVIGARLKAVDSTRAQALPGVRRIVRLVNGVAVAADTFWRAHQAAQELKLTWDEGTGGGIDTDRLGLRWAALAAKPGQVIYSLGEAEDALAGATKTIEAVYTLPFQAHATPEPMNATAQVREDRCDVWAPTQNQDAAKDVAARISGLPYDRVFVHTTYAGGGFGRRVEVDYVAEAVTISKEVRAPVKVVWTREEDFRHDFYRPASHNLLRAGFDKNGRLSAWFHRLVGPDHMAQRLASLAPGMIPYQVPRALRNGLAAGARYLAPRLVPGKKAGEGAAPLPYAVPHVRVEHVQDDPGVPVGFWRSVAHSSNAFVVECFLDEAAAAAGRDPVEMRLDLLKDNARLREVLAVAAEKAAWRGPRRDEVGRGVAAHDFHDTMLACVADVSVRQDQGLRVHRVVMAVDCGTVINPRIVQAQIRGGIAFGLTAALKSAVTIRRGRVVPGNYDDFPILRFDEMPEVEVHLIPSSNPPSGIGEAAVPLIAPAVVNAVFAATGRRIRTISDYLGTSIKL